MGASFLAHADERGGGALHFIRPARALQAGVLGAGAAGKLELFAQRLASPVQADGRVCARNSGPRRGVGEAQALHLHGAQDLGVLRLERGNDPVHALAHRLLEGRPLRCRQRCRARAGLHGTAPGVPPPVNVDQRTAQEPVEPGDSALAFAEVILSLERLDEGGLQQLLDGCAAARPRLEEAQEAIVLCDERLDDVGRDRVSHRFDCSHVRQHGVARWRSSCAPVETSPKTSSSATRPPSSTSSRSRSSARVIRYRSSVGCCCVYPSAAMPRGITEILATRSACLRDSATSACPASWYATISFSLGLITRDFRSIPPTTRSMASSKSAMSTASLP